ncbi:MAG: hypothetical protein P8078_12585, partial [bacterium]
YMYNFYITPGFNGDGNVPCATLLSVSDVYANADGTVLFTDPLNRRVRRITNSMPAFDLNPITVASKDGTQIYIFDKNGRHLKTQDALTGKTIREFSYDDNGLLTEITDRDGLTTVIQRDAEGNPSAIISPFGQQTLLDLDENGLLKMVTDPQGNKKQFFYDENGLLTRMIDPGGGEYNYTYDEYGKLIKDEDPAGGWKELSKEELDNGFEVTYSTAEGLSKKYKSYLKSDGSKVMENINASGLTTVSESYPKGKTVLYSPDSTVTVKYLKPDPRYGMQSPLIDTLKVITPSGLTSVMTQSKTITEMSGLTVTGMADSVTVNNKTSVNYWDGNDNSSVSLSPEGRMSFTYRNDTNRVIADSIPG